MKNDYLKRRDADRQQFFVAGCETATQQMWDMMCLVLNDPEIMGKDTFGAERLKKVHKALFDRESYYHEAWIGTNESDYYQEKLDSEIKRIFGDDAPDFKTRYPYVMEYDYRRGKWISSQNKR